jgi:hypothetical protein
MAPAAATGVRVRGAMENGLSGRLSASACPGGSEYRPSDSAFGREAPPCLGSPLDVAPRPGAR